MRFWSAIAVIWAVTAACTAERSPVCREVCAREARCIETAEANEINFDQNECESTCTVLARDPEGKELVAAHAECVARATSCAQVFECM